MFSSFSCQTNAKKHTVYSELGWEKKWIHAILKRIRVKRNAKSGPRFELSSLISFPLTITVTLSAFCPGNYAFC